MSGKKRVIFVGLIAVVLVAGAAAVRMVVMQNRLNRGYAEVSPIELESLRDGTYRGSFSDFMVMVDLEVDVRDGAIREIRIIRQESGPNHDAAETVDRIVHDQTPLVDMVSGATGSSKAIIIAVHRALTGAGD